ncbi:helix-turn-helix domain-containing protein [Micromonosporaceae bacterium Da 78-11]
MKQARGAIEERTDLAGRVGRLLQSTRIQVGASQGQLAERAGSTQQWVSRVERGRTNPRLGDVERLFGALGRRLVVQSAAGLYGRDDPDLMPASQVAAELTFFVGYYGYCWRRFREVPYLISGRFGALCHGLPVRPVALDLVLAERDVEAASRAMQWFNATRWSDRNQAFTNFSTDLAAPQPLRFRTGAGFELRFAVVTDLPTPVRVEAGGHSLPLLPLADLLRADLDVAALADRIAAHPPRAEPLRTTPPEAPAPPEAGHRGGGGSEAAGSEGFGYGPGLEGAAGGFVGGVGVGGLGD